MLFLRDHGRLPGDVSFRSVEVAWKYKMSELQAALGRVQLARIDELIDRKRQIFGWYADRLAGDAIALNAERDRRAGDVLDGDGRVRRGDRCRRGHGRCALARRQHRHAPVLSTAQLAPGVRRLARRRAALAARNPVSYDLAERAINLPSALTLTEDQVDRVCEVVRRLAG